MITLATLANATEQEVFNQVARHLLTQRKKSTNNFGHCCYRNNSGLMCAAGCLIAPEEYSISFEGVSWDLLVEEGKVPSVHEPLIANLQSIHDCYRTAAWYNLLTGLANSYGFSKEVLNEFSQPTKESCNG